MLARIMVNENSRHLRTGEFTADAHAIAAVVENNQHRLLAKRAGHGHRNVRNWMEVMGELAPHVTKTVPGKPGRQYLWTRNLPAKSCGKPEGFRRKWPKRYAEGWCTFREKVIYAWVHDTFRWVPGRPTAWASKGVLKTISKRRLCLVKGVGTYDPKTGKGNGFARKCRSATDGHERDARNATR